MSYQPFPTSLNGTGTTGPHAVILKLSASATLTQNRVITLSSGDEAASIVCVGGLLAAPAGSLTGTTLAANVVTTSITTVGALNAGSITSGFGSIDVGADSITGGHRLAATNATYNLGSTTSKFLVGYIQTISDGAAATGALLDTSGTGVLHGSGSDWSIHRFYTGGAERAQITATGINSTVIGATTAAAGSFTTLVATGIISSTLSANATQLLIQGTNTTSGTSSAVGSRYTTNAGSADILATSSAYTDITGAADAFLFKANNLSGGFQFSVDGAASSATISSTGLAVTGIGSFTYTGAGGGLTLLNSDDTSNTIFTSFRGSGGVIGSISRVTTTNAVAYNTTSDRDRKENIRDFTSLDSGRFIDLLQPRWFDWREDGEDEIGETKIKRRDLSKSFRDKLTANNTGIIGFVAQEMQEVDDEIVRDALIRCGAITLDSQGVARQIDKTALVPILFAEVKSLRARLAAAGL